MTLRQRVKCLVGTRASHLALLHDVRAFRFDRWRYEARMLWREWRRGCTAARRMAR